MPLRIACPLETSITLSPITAAHGLGATAGNSSHNNFSSEMTALAWEQQYSGSARSAEKSAIPAFTSVNALKLGPLKPHDSNLATLQTRSPMHVAKNESKPSATAAQGAGSGLGTFGP